MNLDTIRAAVRQTVVNTLMNVLNEAYFYYLPETPTYLNIALEQITSDYMGQLVCFSTIAEASPNGRHDVCALHHNTVYFYDNYDPYIFHNNSRIAVIGNAIADILCKPKYVAINVKNDEDDMVPFGPHECFIGLRPWSDETKENLLDRNICIKLVGERDNVARTNIAHIALWVDDVLMMNWTFKG